MKCAFCGMENPAYANFCMNCGSPQDLKSCEKCGTINQKNATECQACGIAFGNSNSATHLAPTAPTLRHVDEAEALAKETATFKRLLAELEEDVNEELAGTKVRKQMNVTRTSNASPAFSPQSESPAAAGDQPIVVEPPPYLQQLLSEREASDKHSKVWRLLVIISLLVIVCGIGYYVAVENGYAPPIPQTEAYSTLKSNPRETKPISEPQNLPASSATSTPPDGPKD